MSRKRDKIARRRQVAKTRAGQSRPSKRKGVSGAPPADEPARRAPMMDVWIAVGIVVGVIALLVAAYFIFVRRPAQGINPTVEVNVTTPTEASTPKPMSWSAPPEMALTPGVDYQAIIVTERGDIRIDLYEEQTPLTVNNLVFLARQGYYDGVTFHRVIPGFMAQTGDPTGTGTGGPGYTFADEFDPALRHEGEGVVSMANTGDPGTNGGQFFITYATQSHLDDQHTVFGRVVEGMDVVRALTPRTPDPNAPAGDRILTIEIIEG